MLSNSMSLAPKIDEVRTFALDFNLDLFIYLIIYLRQIQTGNITADVQKQ